MFHITPELEKNSKKVFTQMLRDNKNTATLSKKGTNIKLTIVKKGSAEEKDFAETIIKEIISEDGVFFISR